MNKYMPTVVLLAGLFALTAIHPSAQTTLPPFVSCASGGVLYMDAFAGATARPVYHCIDPSSLIGKSGPAGPMGPQGAQGPPGPAGSSGIFTGSACNPPGTGALPYAQLPDNSCLPIIVVPAAGSVAMNVQATWQDDATSADASPLIHLQYIFADLVPVPAQ